MPRTPSQTDLTRSQIRRLLTERFGDSLSLDPPPEPMSLRPPVLLRERLRRAIAAPALAGAVVFLIAVIVAVAIVWSRPHHAEAVQPSAEPAAAALVSTRPTQSPEKPEDGAGHVHVVGAVKHPGVFRMPAGARVEAALEAAGGPIDSADLSGVNLARPVQDGEQIVVPDRSDTPSAVAGGATSPVPQAAASAAPGAVIDLNSAGASALETLPRIGPALAGRIVEWREANGRFRSLDDLREVPGIGEKILDGIRDSARAG